MLDRAERLNINSACTIPVVYAEDLIGLKVQASVNDIYLLIDHTARLEKPLDWELIEDYLEAFR